VEGTGRDNVRLLAALGLAAEPWHSRRVSTASRHRPSPAPLSAHRADGPSRPALRIVPEPARPRAPRVEVRYGGRRAAGEAPRARARSGPAARQAPQGPRRAAPAGSAPDAGRAAGSRPRSPATPPARGAAPGRRATGRGGRPSRGAWCSLRRKAGPLSHSGEPALDPVLSGIVDAGGLPKTSGSRWSHHQKVELGASGEGLRRRATDAIIRPAVAPAAPPRPAA
jgi:hypothetical protein